MLIVPLARIRGKYDVVSIGIDDLGIDLNNPYHIPCAGSEEAPW
jgi:hypothetical protein